MSSSAVWPRKMHYQTREFVDQGALPYAVGAAWRHYLVSNPTAMVLGPSHVDIHKGAKQIDGLSDAVTGTTIRAGGDFLRLRGIILNYYWLETAEQIRLIMLMGKGPVVCGMDWWTGMDEPRETYATLTGDIEGTHAFILCGWDDEIDAGRILNSHGREYGQRGRKWIKRHDLNLLLQENGEACYAVGKRVGHEARARRKAFLAQILRKHGRETYELLASV